MYKSDYRFFEKAKQAAMVSTFYKTRVGCVAIYRKTIIAIGCNTDKTHPVQKMYNRYRDCTNQPDCLPKMHAEINCMNSLRHLEIDVSKIKLYICRLKKDGSAGLSRPCPSCMAAIREFGIRHIFYTTNDGYAYEELDRKVA